MTLFDVPEAPAVIGPTSRVRLTVAYDGGDFHGFAVNAGVRTVGGDLTDAIGRVLGHPVTITCAGRTDRGVHARGQVVTFDAATARIGQVARADLVRSLNALCGPAVAVRDAAVVDDGFDARFSARSRRYRYRVWTPAEPDPFSARTAWHLGRPLDRALLSLACDPFLGEHDFSAFCRRPKRDDGEASLVRRVLDAGWTEEREGMLGFEITATAFCHQMVRAIVGTLVSVGLGRLRAGDIRGIIAGRDRAAAGDLAPAHGLILWSVAYDGWSS